ncbi:FkbM family methyltransferase [Ningiella sp. W23]|uniref:FkbM family methyltransferase n=1 Tax=Ningiella sp. W23 TaxID=3023715 RepID=UPI003756F2F1
MSLKTKIGWIISKSLYEWNPIKTKRKLKFYSQFIGKNDLCFDVGAHLGDRSKTWLTLGAKVVAVEPQPAFVKYLTNTFGSTGEFSLETCALGQHEGSAELAISHLFPTLSTLAGVEWEAELKRASSLPISFDENIEVRVSTLDRLIAKHGMPKFCKIDVEGFEYDVLLGLTSPIPYVSFEVLSCSLSRAQQCLDRLSALGYKEFNWSYKENFTLQDSRWRSAQQVLEDIRQYPEKLFSGDIYCYCNKAE